MRIGIISDVHEDIQSLEVAYKILREKGCEKIICLGDAIGYDINSLKYYEKRSAAAVIEFLKNHSIITVVGNHDLFHAKKIPKFTAGVSYPETWYELGYNQRKKISKGKVWLYEEKELFPMISNSDVDFLKSLKEYYIMEVEDYKILFSHNIYPDFSGSKNSFADKVSCFAEHFNFLKKNDCLFSFHGHQHPGGITIAKKKSMKSKNYGTHKLRKKRQAIICPATVRGKSKNGCMVFDSHNFILEAIHIKTKKLNVS